MSRGHEHDQLKYGLSLYISREKRHQTQKPRSQSSLLPALPVGWLGENPVVILSEMLLLLDIGADPKLVNKNGQTPLHSCETDEARRILSEKRGLSAMNVDVGYVREV